MATKYLIGYTDLVGKRGYSMKRFFALIFFLALPGCVGGTTGTSGTGGGGDFKVRSVKVSLIGEQGSPLSNAVVSF